MGKSYSVILLMLVLVGREAEGTSVPAVGSQVTSYDELLSAIREAKAASRSRIEALVETEKVREAWEIGKLIDTHVLQHKERADYGKQVLDRLAKDLGTSQTELSFMLQFAREYPIYSPANKLSWSHYRELLSLDDSREREELETQAVREGWGRDRVREEVQRRQAAKKPAEQKEPAQTILRAAPGKPGIYRVVKAHYGKQPDQLVLDLGFSNYYRPPGRFPFKEGDIVEFKKGKLHKLEASEIASPPSPASPVPRARNDSKTEEELQRRTVPSSGADAAVVAQTAQLQRRTVPSSGADAAVVAQTAQLFTYSASVIHVIDGDTFTAAVELGFGFTTVQTLRLRALDAPEIESAEGREAKKYLESLLVIPAKAGIHDVDPRLKHSGMTTENQSGILIRTRRSDKYDRYLADVFVNGEYINQKLVDKGFAVPLSPE